jgi:hypothetical protein
MSAVPAAYPSGEPTDAQGRLNPQWRAFFLALFNRSGGTQGVDLSGILSSISSLTSELRSAEAEIEAAPHAAAFAAGVMAAIECIGAQIAQGSAVTAPQQDERGEAGESSAVAALISRIEHLESQIERIADLSASQRLDELESVAAAGAAQSVSLTVSDVSGAAPIDSPTLTGAVGVGSDGNTNNGLFVGGSLTGTSGTQYGIQNNVEFNSTATGSGYGYISSPRLKAATFTMSNLYGFLANTPVLGSGASLGVYEAFVVQDFGSATTRNAGLRMKMASGANKWNIYADGSANSYHAGALQIGSSTNDGSGNKLQVSTGISISPATTTTAPAAGAAGALPATPTGYATIRIGGTDRKIAYY